MTLQVLNLSTRGFELWELRQNSLHNFFTVINVDASMDDMENEVK
jgi:hypothetical protein